MNRTQYIIASILLILCSALTLWWGETSWSLAWSGAVKRLTGESTAWNPILDERLPRLIVILCSGASLAVAGAVMQSLFQNPLASPSVLGITPGGCLLVIFVLVQDWHYQYPYAVPVAAVIGCLATLLLVYSLSNRNGRVNLTTLILTGIAISTVLIAIQGAIMYALRDRWHLIQSITEWEAGSTIDRTWQHVHMQLPLALVGLTGCWFYRQEMNILALGDEEARNLGVEVEKVRWRLFLCVSLLAGGAIAAVGIIAFFGLVLPHMIRKVYGPDNKLLIPLCIFFGACTLSYLDLIVRLFSVHMFSIGNISAILGGLFFLILLFRTGVKRGEVGDLTC